MRRRTHALGSRCAGTSCPKSCAVARTGWRRRRSVRRNARRARTSPGVGASPQGWATIAVNPRTRRRATSPTVPKPAGSSTMRRWRGEHQLIVATELTTSDQGAGLRGQGDLDERPETVLGRLLQWTGPVGARSAQRVRGARARGQEDGEPGSAHAPGNAWLRSWPRPRAGSATRNASGCAQWSRRFSASGASACGVWTRREGTW